MADGVPDYLEVPVTEDGLLEKATAAIHALGYDMEEAISIFLRRIVQTVPSAADLEQAEEGICKIADTALDDMVTQPLLIPQRDVFSVELLDYATPGHCTNWKPYFGTIEDIAAFRNALYQDENRKVEDMSFVPVKVYGAKQKARDAGIYEHTNIWGYPYFVWWDRLESVHLWIRSGGSFFRCVRARMKNLKYGWLTLVCGCCDRCGSNADPARPHPRNHAGSRSDGGTASAEAERCRHCRDIGHPAYHAALPPEKAAEGA